MTKVKTTTARKSGVATSESSKDQKALEGKKVIHAKRGDEERNFTLQIWNHLPPDKEGWKEVAGKPAEPQSKIDTSNPTSDQIKNAENAVLKKQAYESYVSAFGKEPEGDLSTEELNQAIFDNVESEKGMVDHVLTQEDLDLNPSLAEEGHKVGETIRVKGETE